MININDKFNVVWMDGSSMHLKLNVVCDGLWYCAAINGSTYIINPLSSSIKYIEKVV